MDKFLLKKPIITEKATDLSKERKYVFRVDSKTTASEAKKTIQQEYGIKIIKTNVINIKGKKRGFGKMKGERSGYKKIIVTLQKGQKLDTISQ